MLSPHHRRDLAPSFIPDQPALYGGPRGRREELQRGAGVGVHIVMRLVLTQSQIMDKVFLIIQFLCEDVSDIICLENGFADAIYILPMLTMYYRNVTLFLFCCMSGISCVKMGLLILLCVTCLMNLHTLILEFNSQIK